MEYNANKIVNEDKIVSNQLDGKITSNPWFLSSTIMNDNDYTDQTITREPQDDVTNKMMQNNDYTNQTITREPQDDVTNKMMQNKQYDGNISASKTIFIIALTTSIFINICLFISLLISCRLKRNQRYQQTRTNDIEIQESTDL